MAAPSAGAGRRRLRSTPRRRCSAATVSMPILVAPVAFQRLAHPDGEPAMARAAAAAGTIMCLSTLATARPREVAAAAPGGAALVPALLLPRPRGHRRARSPRPWSRGSRRSCSPSTPRVPGRRERDLRTRLLGPSGAGAQPGGDAASDRPASVAEVLGLVDPTLTWGTSRRSPGRARCPCWSRGC